MLEIEHCSDANVGLGVKPAVVKDASVQPLVDGNSIGRFKFMPGKEGNCCQVDAKNDRGDDTALFDTHFDRKRLRDQASSNYSCRHVRMEVF